MYECIRVCVSIYEYVWVFMSMYECIAYVGMCERIWVRMGVNEYV